MKHTYDIVGMSCNGCRNHVETTLSKVEGVKEALVNLEEAKATIETEYYVSIERLQKALANDGGNYSIRRLGGKQHSPNHISHSYHISGMSCNGCRSHIEDLLAKVEGVKSVGVILEEAKAIIEMESNIPIKRLQRALANDGGNYSIYLQGDHHQHDYPLQTSMKPKSEGKGTFYCPMHCEGNKTYDEAGDCPVCGMDLLEEQNLNPSASEQWTCPMHPEVLEYEAGDCPKCGMELVRKEPDLSSEEKTYQKLAKKFWIAVSFTFPIFLIAMSEMILDNPLYKIMDVQYWNWVQFGLSIPVVFYATWMFFQRAYSSIVRKSPNMFTLIGIGAGVAWLFSFFGLLFPDFFPAQFKTNSGAVHVYFEAASVILTLVLLGQLLEARAHSKTNTAVKELLKLAPKNATKVVDGEEVMVKIDEIKLGDILKVKPGEKIPVDGIIVEGQSNIDESMITGEPIPVEKTNNDEVSSGAINGTQSFFASIKKD